MEKESKTVKMTPNQTEETKEAPKKLSYEQLEQVANKLGEQCKVLYQRCQNAENAIASFNEVEMLLNILDKSAYFKEAFIERCADTIQKIINNALDTSEKQEAENNEK